MQSDRIFLHSMEIFVICTFFETVSACNDIILSKFNKKKKIIFGIYDEIKKYKFIAKKKRNSHLKNS